MMGAITPERYKQAAGLLRQRAEEAEESYIQAVETAPDAKAASEAFRHRELARVFLQEADRLDEEARKSEIEVALAQARSAVEGGSVER